ncbi:hypothetical protein M8Q70_000605 [Salmonella enterica]|nr:hypothetical protein [Salmonella enterica subsp. enterica serovar Carmel]EIC5003731.1 hypothetical protein [Salmonella enterica]EJF4883297.1 hypothetical protein [Salmonella enterica]EJS4188921.1 hypothetical protein [Salmonella enterica]
MGSSLHSQGGQEASPRYRSLPHAACSSRPVTGQRRPWNTAAVICFDGQDMPRKRLEGRAFNGEGMAYNHNDAGRER